jgi:hypothetical protein
MLRDSDWLSQRSGRAEGGSVPKAYFLDIDGVLVKGSEMMRGSGRIYHAAEAGESSVSVPTK